MNTAVATLEPRRSVLMAMSERYGMEPQAFEQTLRATVVPKECTKEEFAAFLLVAREYNLNPITKEIYAFPKKGGGIQPIVSVDGWANLINSHPQCDGFEFEDIFDDKGELASITCRMHRKDRKYPVAATEYMVECRRDIDTWKKWPRRMLRHKALIQCARYAFGFAGIVDPDEAERDTGHYAATPGAKLVPPPAPTKTPQKSADPSQGPSAPEPEPIKTEVYVPEALPGDWQSYIDRQYSEFVSARSSSDKQAVSDAVTDAITSARERGELSPAEVETISEAWNGAMEQAG